MMFDLLLILFAMGALAGSVKVCEWIVRGGAGLIWFVWDWLDRRKESPERGQHPGGTS